jgi:hypothetical protein
MDRLRRMARPWKRSALERFLLNRTECAPTSSRRLRIEPLEDRRVMAVTVEAFVPTASGFTATLSEEIRVENLNLYDAQSEVLGDADVVLRGANTGDVRGSLIVNGTDLHFIASGGALQPDDYTATLRSAANGIVDAALGQWLDGEFDGVFPSGDGVPGGDFVISFTVGPLPAIVVGMPDFARGPSQSVNVPAIGSGIAPLGGLPIRFSQTEGITSLTMTVDYDPSLLDVSDVTLGRDAPSGSQVEVNLTVPGQLRIAFFSLDPMPSGPADLLNLVATVPEDAEYGQAHVLRVTSLEINGGDLQAIADDAVHVVAFVGDANANRRYEAEDARLIARVAAGLDSGFAVSNPTGTDPGRVLYPTIDPRIIGDVTGLDGISPLDASDMLRVVVGLPVANLPALPESQAPMNMTLSSNQIREGLPTGTVVGQLFTDDPDPGDTHTYTLVSGTGSDDNSSFVIANDELVTAAIFDFETRSSYSVRVRSTDSQGLFIERVFTIDVLKANSAPTAIELSDSSVAEAAEIGTPVGTFSTIDPDTGDSHSYTFAEGEGDDDNGAFQIVENQLITAANFDFATNPTHTIRVRSTDSGEAFFEQIFVITVIKTNSAPTAIELSDSTVVGNAAPGVVIGTLSTEDPDEGDLHTYALASGDGGEENEYFEIVGNELIVRVELDFDLIESFRVRIRSTDLQEASIEGTFTITRSEPS